MLIFLSFAILGWIPFESGQCQSMTGLGDYQAVQYFGFAHLDESGALYARVLPAYQLTSDGLWGSKNAALMTFMSTNQKFCVHIRGPFDRIATKKNLEECPAGELWHEFPMSWVLDPGSDDYTLDIRFSVNDKTIRLGKENTEDSFNQKKVDRTLNVDQSTKIALKKIAEHYPMLDLYKAVLSVYREVILAFAANDRDRLKKLTSAIVFNRLIKAIDERNRQGEVLITQIVDSGIKKINSISINDNIARGDLRLFSKQKNIIYRDNVIVSGSFTEIIEYTDDWVFELEIGRSIDKIRVVKTGSVN